MGNPTNNYIIDDTKELVFKDLIQILGKYKWSILIITALSMMLSYSYVYFKPSIYDSYAIIKVKPRISSKADDIIDNAVATKKNSDVLEEMSLLRTFKMNQYALSKINFKVQYFTTKNYKTLEIYNKSPIQITKIKFLEQSVMDRKLTLIPRSNGYSITYLPTYKEKIRNFIFKTPIFTMNNKKIYPYNKEIQTEYFKLRINKVKEITKPIHFIIHGSNREIFENIIRYRLNIKPLEKDTSLIKISYQDPIPKRAQIYVDTLIESFIKSSIDKKNKRNKKTLDFIVKELRTIKRQLKKSEQQLEAYQVSKSLVKPSEQASLYVNKLSDIEIKISENKLKKKLILNLINFVQNNYNLAAIAPSLSKLKEDNTLRLIDKLQDYQLKIEELSLDYTNRHPKIIILRRKIKNVRTKIEFNLKSLRSNIEYQTKNLQTRKENYENDLKTLPSQERQLINIKRNYEVKSRMYEYLLKKEAENKIIQLATFSDYQIIDYAYNSNTPLKTKKTLILIASIFFGIILGSMLAFIRNGRNTNIQSQNDIENTTSLPIYGTIPFSKQKKYILKVKTEMKSPFSESFRTLRTNLQFIKKDKTATTILISSTIASEGKTTISANLATILEMAHYKTLLINLDIRKPTLHKFFSLNNNIGMSNYLDGQYTADDIILQTEFANLDIITSGPIVDNPSELVLSKRLPILLEKLKSKYDYIIIDTAPIGIVTDTKTIIPYCDLNLIILREKYAKKNFILTLEQMIKKHNFKNVGLLLNASNIEGGEYGYGYSYEYGQ